MYKLLNRSGMHELPPPPPLPWCNFSERNGGWGYFLLSFGVQPFATPYDKVQVNTTTLVYNSFIRSDLL